MPNRGMENYALEYIEEFKNRGCSVLIRNLSTQVGMLEIDDNFMPVTINVNEYENSYVCSPYTAFVSYALEELRHLNAPLLQSFLRSAITSISKPLKKAEINRVAAINNWMLSTNLYPQWPWNELRAITQFLIQRFPEHYLVFRSLNFFANKSALIAFRKAGYRLLPTRQVYIYPIRDTKWRHKHNVEMDLKLLQKTRLILVENEGIKDADYERIAELYRMLYIEKYSQHNPQYTADYMSLCHQKKIMSFRGFRDADGRLCTVVGSFAMNGIVTAPIVGYDTSVNQKIGLYRLAIALIMQKALEEGVDLHLSAGAAAFKRLRGGAAYIEYSAVYDRHLTLRRQITSALLTLMTKLTFVPLMKMFKL